MGRGKRHGKICNPTERKPLEQPMGRAERTRNAGRSEGGACEASISAGVPNCGGVHGSQIQAGKGGEIDGTADGAGEEVGGGYSERQQKAAGGAAVHAIGCGHWHGAGAGAEGDAGRQECMRSGRPYMPPIRGGRPMARKRVTVALLEAMGYCGFQEVAGEDVEAPWALDYIAIAANNFPGS